MSHAPSSLTGFRAMDVPAQYRDHSLLQGAPFFTLPRDLLDGFLREVKRDRFDAKLLEMEYALSDICGNHSDNIGFWGWQPVDFKLLRHGQLQYSDEKIRRFAEAVGRTIESAQEVIALGNVRYQRLNAVCRGYLGWLMTSRLFLKEHYQLFEKWNELVTQDGIPKMGPVVRDASAFPGSADIAAGNKAEFIKEFEDFFVRWRLDGMSAPFAPRPLAPHLPVSDLRPVLGHMSRGGTTFYFPDIFPVPTRDELRNIMEEALRSGSTPVHLEGWSDIVKAENAVKNKIPRYGRIFEIQHYVRALYGRHSESLSRKKSAVKRALSAFLGVSDGTIEKDLDLIAKRLECNDWYGRSI